MQVKTYLISEGVKYTETIIEDGYINKIYKVDNCRKDIYAIPDACIDIHPNTLQLKLGLLCDDAFMDELFEKMDKGLAQALSK